MSSRPSPRHRAERTQLAALTGAIRAVAVDAPKGAGRSAVVVATAGGIAMSAIAPAAADSLPVAEREVDTHVHVAKIAYH